MEKLLMCRMCLATDVRFCSLSGNLKHMYEKITAMSFQRKDKRPLVACYICHARLRNCYRLRMSCLQSEELLTKMQSSGVLKPQEVTSTSTFRIKSVFNLSMGHMLQKSTVHIKEEAPEVVDSVQLDDINLELQEEHGARIDDNIPCSYLEDHLDLMNRELDDIETDTEDITLETQVIIKEDNDEDENIAGPSSQSTDNICQMTTVVSGRIQNNATTGTPDLEKPETVNKNTVINKRVKRSNTNETIDRTDATLRKRKDNKVTADEDVRKQKPNKKKCLNIKSIRTKSHSKSHISTPTDEKRFQCYICNKCFKRNSHLTLHIRTHTGVKPYMCDVCQKCFIQKSKLTIHARTHSSAKPFMCDICKKGYTKKDGLVQHMRTHIANKPHMCDICNKCFTRKGTLIEHTRIHTGDKPYQCDVCKKSFTRKSSLKEHSRTHTGDKPFMCHICENFYTKKETLVEHIRMHTGNKPFMCDECKKSFSRKNTLIDHIRSHTGGKPYSCRICKKRVRTRFALKKHIRTHTGGKK